MNTLHIVQGGVENGDKTWLEEAAREKLTTDKWVAPKSANIGDEVVIFVPGNGFFATARISSEPKKRTDWSNRYGVGLTSIRLIKPAAIALATIRRELPELIWANYPRSITTPVPEVAAQVRVMIARRRKMKPSDLDVETLENASIDELRAIALWCSRSVIESKKRTTNYRVGSLAIHRYVLCRAKGLCEGCRSPAPFIKPDGSPYLEPHHTTRLADDGPDHPARVIALCPNCHRRAHHAEDAEAFNALMKKKLPTLEPK